MSTALDTRRDDEFKPVTIAKDGERWPTFVRKFNPSAARFEENLGVLQDLIVLYTTRDTDEVQGEAWRNMPSPSMLQIAEDGHLLRLPESERHVQMLLGEPGCGKTFLLNHLAKLRDARGVVEVSCANRDLGDLFYQNVLDYDAGKDLYDSIDERLATGDVKPLSLDILKHGLGSAISVEGGRVSIDWQQVGQLTEDADVEPSTASHNAFLQRKAEAFERAKKAILEFAEVEQLGGEGGAMSIGLTTVEGPMIRAWKENRPILLDEFNKAKYGHDSLHLAIQVYIGEKEEFIAEGGNGQQFVFRADERPINHELGLTGNLTHDGVSTISLSESFYQRAQPVEVPDADAADMAHRFCQWLAGGPVTTTYNINQKLANNDPQAFTEYLVEKRKQGLSDEKIRNIPSLQWAQLKNWQDLTIAANQLGEFYEKWRELLNEDSSLYMRNTQNSALFDSILQEIDDDYSKRISPGMRLMKKHIDTARQHRPRSFTLAEADLQGDQPANQNERQKDIERDFGSNLAEVILESIAETTEGKPNLREQLLRYAEEAGIFRTVSRERDLVDTHSQVPLLADLLNAGKDKNRLPSEMVQQAHGLVCDYIREQYGSRILEGKTNDDILSASALESQLERIMAHRIHRDSVRSSVLHLVNTDTLTLHDQPLVEAVSSEQKLPEMRQAPDSPEEQARLKDVQAGESGLDHLSAAGTELLVDAKRLLVSLALPQLGQRNVSALWNDHGPYFTQSTAPGELKNRMASGQDESGLSVNLVRCKTDASGQERDEYLYVINDRFARGGKGETLVTGTLDLSDEMVATFHKSGVTYVNRHDVDAAEQIEAFVNARLEARSEMLTSEQAIQKQKSVLLRSMAAGLSTRFARLPELEMVTNTEGEETDVPKLRFAESLPNPLLAYSDYGNDNVLGSYTLREEIEKGQENLIALLTDSTGTLTRFAAEEQVSPYIVTESPSMDELKHTLRYLNRKDDGPEQTAQVG